MNNDLGPMEFFINNREYVNGFECNPNMMEMFVKYFKGEVGLDDIFKKEDVGEEWLKRELKDI